MNKLGHQIIKQPNGKYCLWSSVVDDFIVTNATKQELIDFYIEQAKQRNEKHINDVINKLEKGDKPYYQFTMSYEEALQQRKRVHGDE